MLHIQYKEKNQKVNNLGYVLQHIFKKKMKFSIN